MCFMDKLLNSNLNPNPVMQDLRAKLDARREEVERLETQLQGAAAEHSRQLQEQGEKVGLTACVGSL